MKLQLSSLIVLLSIAAIPSSAVAQGQWRDERIQAAALLALGRPASADEAAALAAQENATVSDLVGRFRERLQNSTELNRAVAVKAYVDSFGREPAPADVTAPGSGRIYAEQINAHLKTLAQNPGEYAQVIDRAYQRYMRRSAYPGEHAYWQKRPTLSYALLVGCVEDWGRRNSPGLMETTGIPTVSVTSRFLTTLPLSLKVADEARAAISQPVEGDGTLAIAAGRNLIAAGGESIITTGRMHLVVAGNSTLLAGSSITAN